MVDRDRVLAKLDEMDGYLGELRILEVFFQSGALFWYFEVPEAVYQRFLSAKSAALRLFGSISVRTP